MLCLGTKKVSEKGVKNLEGVPAWKPNKDPFE